MTNNILLWIIAVLLLAIFSVGAIAVFKSPDAISQVAESALEKISNIF